MVSLSEEMYGGEGAMPYGSMYRVRKAYADARNPVLSASLPHDRKGLLRDQDGVYFYETAESNHEEFKDDQSRLPEETRKTPGGAGYRRYRLEDGNKAF